MKKGVIKASLVGFFILLLFGVIFFSLFSSAYSSNESMQKNSTLFNFEKGNIYLINTVLKFDLNKLGNYELIITKPSGERISRVSSNDRFSIELLEQGKYSVSIKRGNGKSFYDFLVIPYNENNNSNNSNNSDEDIKTTPVKGELVQEKAEINKPVAWTLILNETLIALPNSTNVTLSKDNGEPFLDYNLTNINGKSYIQIIENVSENITLEYFTEPPKLEEKIISENKKEVIISSPEDVHYEEVLAYTEIPEKLWLGEEDLIEIYWKENNTYINFNASDKDDDGLLDYVEWIVPHLSEQTFEIILIIRAEHLSSNKTFISDIYGQVKELDNIWSETINSGEYVRVVFERTLNSTNDITIYPNISFGIPTLEVYEKDKQELIAKFENITSNEYNKVYLTNLIGEQDTFDLKVVGGSLEFDHIIDPTSIYNMNPSFRAYWGRPTSSNRWQAGTNSTSAQYTALSTEDTSYARNVMPGGTSNDYPFYRFNFTINELPAAITSIYVKFTGYDNATEAGTVYVWRFGNSTWMPIGTTPAANGNVTRNFTSDISNYLDANNQFVIVWQGAAYDAGDAVIIDEVRLIVQYNDIIPPTFTSTPTNSSLFYRNESLGVDFDATDEIGFGNFSVNDTRFSINQTGFLSNATPLAVGNYTLNITINDTSNNLNWTFYKVQVNKSKYYDCGVYFNTSSPKIYPETFVVYTNCSSDYSLYLNGTSISNATVINSGAGYYNFTVQRLDTENYTSTTDTKFFTINQNPENCWVLYNESSPLEYPGHFRAWTNCTTPFTLYRNGTIISNDSEQALGVSAYNFSLQRTDTQNYSINYNQSEFRIVDTTFPLIEFGLTSPKNNSKFARTWIYIDASVIEANEKNITFNLYFSNYTILNSSTYTDLRREINWTGLSEGIYYFNITVADWESHFNTTETRKTTLNFTIPNVFFVYPTEESGTSFSRNWIYANVSVSNLNEEINISFELYNTSSLVNKSVYTDSRREVNWTSLPDTTYYYNVTLFDNPDGMISTLTRDITLDTTNPYFTYIPENSSLFYGNESLYVDFDVEDNMWFGYFSINDTERFSITQAGVLENATVLGVGDYLINVTINDTLNHLNWAIYKVQINKSKYYDCGVYFNTSSPITYPETFIVYTNCSSDYSLYLNGTSISNATVINYGASAYNFSVQRTDSQNYTNTFHQEEFRVNKGIATGTLSSSAGWTIEYPASTDISLTESNQGDSDITYNIYRNSTYIGTGETANFGFGYYNYTLNTTGGTNYTLNSSIDSKILTVDKNQEYCEVLFNTSSLIVYPETFRVWANCTTPFTLYRNGTIVSNNSEQALAAGAYNFSFIRTDSINYTYFYDEKEISIGSIAQYTASAIEHNITQTTATNPPSWAQGWVVFANDTRYNAITNTTTSNNINNTLTSAAGNSELMLRVNFTLQFPINKIMSINITGEFNNPQSGGTGEMVGLHVANWNNSSWFPIGAQNRLTETVKTMTFTDNDSIYSLVRGNQIVLLFEADDADAGETLQVDYASVKVEVDGISPYFTSIPSNTSLFYGNESLGVDFDATDNFLLTSYTVNDTRFSINTTGFLTNSTPLAVGNYTINITIRDAADNLNWTFYSLQINQSNYYNCGVYFNTSSPKTYPETFVVYTNCSSAYSLYRNGTSISNNSEQKNGAGYYNFTVQRTDTQNYTYTSMSQFFTINQNPENCWVLYNESSPLEYPGHFRAWANCTTPFTLRRNGTVISNNSEQALGVSAYNFSLQRTDTQNYSINYNQSEFRITQSTSICGVYFNTSSPKTYPETFVVYTNCSSAYSLYRNGTSISNNSEQKNGAGYYNFTVQRTDTQNYTYTSMSQFFTINQNPEEFNVLFNTSSPKVYPETFRVWSNATSAFTLYRNGTSISNNSEQKNGAGYYNFSAQRTDTLNYSFNNNWNIFNINQNPENCWVLFNETSPLDYPGTFLVWANCTTPFTLYRNGTLVSNNSEQVLTYGAYNFSLLRTDNINYSIYYNETEMIITDTVPPLIDYIFPTRENNSNVSQNWIYINVSVIEDNLNNITFDLYYVNNTLLNSTTFTDTTRSINFTLLQDGKYLYNVTTFDIIGNMNYTSTNKISLDTISPLINLITTDNFNFSSYLIPFLNYSVNDTNEIFNCTLYGNWNGGWHSNQTTNSPTKETVNNFSSISTEGDGYYLWNVQCEDNHGNLGWNSTNYTFSSFLEVISLNSSEFVVYMTSNDATGNVFLSWNASNHTEKYRIYSTEDPLIPFTILAETYDLNYTDLTANETRRRFYKLSALNPISENISEAIIGKTVYYLKRKENINTRNWMGFYIQSNITTANQTLAEINNITSFTMWNSTIQKRMTCNTFSCPDFPSCTETNCNFSFGIMEGFGFEATLNSSSPIFTNWSTVGLVKGPTNVSLVKNSTSSGKNWVSLYYNSSLKYASDLMNSLPYSDTVTNWNELNQKSEGWILSAFPFPIGENFVLEPEKGYEVSVTDNCEYIQS